MWWRNEQVIGRDSRHDGGGRAGHGNRAGECDRYDLQERALGDPVHGLFSSKRSTRDGTVRA